MFPMVILLNYALSLSSQLYTNWLIIFPVESIFGQTLEDNSRAAEEQRSLNIKNIKLKLTQFWTQFLNWC